MPTTHTIRHRNGAYPVLIGGGLLADLPLLAARQLPGRRLVVITDRNVARVLDSPLPVPTLVVAPGERSKSRRRWADLSDKLLSLGYGRDSAVVALGGGVVGDLAGFVAATFLRGVPWLQVPTTLLAMVDASVGGKTGVDTAHGKNLIGAFHPPVAVIADPRALRTLPEAVYRAGLAEVIKHGVIADEEYLRWVEQETDAILRRDEATLVRLVHRSVEIKGALVMRDEFESGERAILNAGHTVAHAIEAVSGYDMPHGEAVAIGLVAEAALAEKLGVAEAAVSARIRALNDALGLPVMLPEDFLVDDLLDAMSHDKKTLNGATRFALPAAIGRMARDGERWTVPADRTAIAAALRVVGAKG